MVPSSMTWNEGMEAVSMKQSADFIPLEPTSPSSANKISFDIEEGGNYDSDDDLQQKSPSMGSEDSPVHPDLLHRDPTFSSTKRPAEDENIDGASPEAVKRQKLATEPPPKALTLPKCIWLNILSLLPPHKLGQLMWTCKFFRKILNDQAIWRESRKLWMPEMPKPVFNLKEWEMLALVKGIGCMICGSKTQTRTVYWAFRVRCCTQCFNKNMTKESTLLEKNFSTDLLTALPFGYIDTSGQWVPHVQGRIPELTKVYWNDDIKLITQRYKEARAMGAEEEWLKGLESEGNKNKFDVMRMETFESKWPAKVKGKPAVNSAKPNAQDAPGLLTVNNTQQTVKANWHPHSRQQNSPIAHPCNQYVQQGHPGQSGMMQLAYDQHLLGSAILSSSQHGQVAVGSSWRTVYSQAQHPCSSQLQVQTRASGHRLERSISEVTEVRRARQLDIEARCMQLDPPIYPNILQHIPAFKNAMLIAVPFTDQAWENLSPKLLEQHEEAEAKERAKLESQMILQKQIEEKRQFDALQRELKEKKEREWEEIQAPVKEKLDRYATDIIEMWLVQTPPGLHPGTNKDAARKFAPEVLVQIRQKFYQESPYSADDPNHMIMLDPNTPQGAAILDKPTSNRLMLENMKYVFDTRIKPITDLVGKELFLCSGCDNNPKHYGFEGVIQHYAAKHTTTMSLGSVIVHWKSDWPYHPPFVIDPLITSSGAGKATHIRQQGLHFIRPSNNASFNSINAAPGMGMHIGPQMEISHNSTMITNNYQNGEGLFVNGTCAKYPMSPHGYQNSFPQSQIPMAQQFTHNPMNGVTVLQQTSPHTSFLHHSQKSDIHRAQLEQIASTARKAWFQLNGIKDLQSSVRIHYVIQKVVRAFQAAFSPLVPQLSMFIEALREHNLMKPMRSVNGLQCLACTIHPPHANGSSCAVNPMGRVFTLISLIQHFEMVHVVRSRSPLKVDWKTQMIRLPEQRGISALRDTMGMDEEKLRLLKEVFPVAFNMPSHMSKNNRISVPSLGPFPKPFNSTTPHTSNATNTPSSPRNEIRSEDSPTPQEENRIEKSGKRTLESHTSLTQSSESELIREEKVTENSRNCGNDKVSTPSVYSVKNETHSAHTKSDAPSVSTKADDTAVSVTADITFQSNETPQFAKEASMTAAEKFLATFLQDDESLSDSKVTTTEYGTAATDGEKQDKMALMVHDAVDAVEISTQQGSRNPVQGTNLDQTGHSASIKLEPQAAVTDAENYYRHRMPPQDDERQSAGYHTVSHLQKRYRHSNGSMPHIMEPGSPPRRKVDSYPEERGRGREIPRRPYSPHDRSRSPRIHHPQQCYSSSRSSEVYYKREEVDLYSRIPMHYQRVYISEDCYREANRDSKRLPPSRRDIAQELHYYDNLYESSRYSSEETTSTRKARERSKSPPIERPTHAASRNAPPGHQEYKYSSARPDHYPPPYYTYPQRIGPTIYPYPDDGGYYHRLRSRSPSRDFDQVRQGRPPPHPHEVHSRRMSGSSRYPVNSIHGHPSSLDVRSSVNYNGYIQYREREDNGGGRFFQHYHSGGEYESSSAGLNDQRH